MPHASLFSSVPANTFGLGVPPINLAGTTENEDAVFPMPTMALAYRPEQSNVTLGLGIFAVAGFGLDYAGSATNPVLTAPAPNGIGFGPIFAQYQALQIAPSLVYDVNPCFSVSVSPLVNIAMLQFDPGAFAAPDDANGDGFATYPGGTHSTSSWGAGFSVGAYYDAGDWAFGASYKSEQHFQTYEFNTTDELGRPGSAEFDLSLPAIVSLGASYEGIEHVLLAADVRYLDFENTDGFGDSGFSPTGALRGLGFESVWAVALGAQLQLSDALTARLGYSWGENPIPDAQSFANVATPVIVEHTLSVGATWDVTDALSFSFAYSHGFENEIEGPFVLPVGTIPNTLVRSTGSVDMFLFGATVRFGCRRSDCCDNRRISRQCAAYPSQGLDSCCPDQTSLSQPLSCCP